MSTPTVTEIPPHPEPVVHDTFIDDIPVVERRRYPAAPRDGASGERRGQLG